MRSQHKYKIGLLAGASIFAVVTPMAAMAQTQDPATDPSAQQEGAVSQIDDIVVVARSRGETLISVPVAVASISPDTLTRNVATDLTKIAEITPSVIISSTKQTGGGSIGIRGISSPANVAGFEQAVSVALDGVQTSNGRIAGIGFFDVQQVDVMRGPQALFFGKNSPAGVISVTSAGPTSEFRAMLSTAYEFEGDERFIDATVSGPITDKLGYRLAVRSRDLEGWMYNDARPIANPFYNPTTMPAGAALLPGAANHRVGSDELLGRLTLEYRPTDNITGTLKVFHSRYRDDGPGAASQNIGPCAGPNPRMYGVADPFGECRADNHTSTGDVSPTVGAGIPLTDGTGTSFGQMDFTSVSGRLVFDYDKFSITSLTGYNKADVFSQYGLDHTVYSQLYSAETDDISEFSQEVRFSTSLDGPLNFAGGVYYQDTDRAYHADVKLSDGAYDPASGRFDSVDVTTDIQGRTYSAYGQVIWDLSPTIELAAGTRYTDETKKDVTRVLYGVGAFNVSNMLFPGETVPGQLSGEISETNWSPEATLTWRPNRDMTYYVAYKTGFKSGGFQAALPNATTRIEDIGFGSETVRGFEIGAKADLLDRRLRVTSAAFAYDFEDLQVNAYDPIRTTFIVGNAGAVEQRGAEFEATYQATDQLSLRTAVTYVRNRFADYVGQCYAYAFPTGSTRATATPPPNCEFANTTTLALQQNNDGRTPARSPDWSGNAGFTYDMNAGALLWTLTGDASYMGRYNASDTFSPYSMQDSFWRFNASASVATQDDTWRLSLIGRNLSNEYYVAFASDRTGGASVPGNFGEQRGTTARGREVMLQLTYRY